MLVIRNDSVRCSLPKEVDSIVKILTKNQEIQKQTEIVSQRLKDLQDSLREPRKALHKHISVRSPASVATELYETHASQEDVLRSSLVGLIEELGYKTILGSLNTSVGNRTRSLQRLEGQVRDLEESTSRRSTPLAELMSPPAVNLPVKRRVEKSIDWEARFYKQMESCITLSNQVLQQMKARLAQQKEIDDLTHQVDFLEGEHAYLEVPAKKRSFADEDSPKELKRPRGEPISGRNSAAAGDWKARYQREKSFCTLLEQKSEQIGQELQLNKRHRQSLIEKIAQLQRERLEGTEPSFAEELAVCQREFDQWPSEFDF